MTNDDQTSNAYATRAAVRSSRRTALLAAAGAGLLLVGAAGFALAASPSPAASGANGSTAVPDATPAPDASGSPGGPAGGGPGFPGRGGGPGAGLFGGILGGPGRPFGAIHITGIDGWNVSLATDDGWKRTIAIGSDTTIMRAGETISVADLKVGDEVRLVETRANDGSYTITRLDVMLPSVAGQVTAVGSDTITVKRLDGTTATVHVGSDTTYVARGNADAALSDVTVGSEVLAQGSARDDGSIDAVRVAIGRPTIVEGGRGPGFRFGPQGPKGQGGNPASPSPSTSASGA